MHFRLFLILRYFKFLGYFFILISWMHDLHTFAHQYSMCVRACVNLVICLANLQSTKLCIQLLIDMMKEAVLNQEGGFL